jgi:hypothetical protein
VNRITSKYDPFWALQTGLEVRTEAFFWYLASSWSPEAMLKMRTSRADEVDQVPSTKHFLKDVYKKESYVRGSVD